MITSHSKYGLIFLCSLIPNRDNVYAMSHHVRLFHHTSKDFNLEVPIWMPSHYMNPDKLADAIHEVGKLDILDQNTKFVSYSIAFNIIKFSVTKSSIKFYLFARSLYYFNDNNLTKRELF